MERKCIECGNKEEYSEELQRLAEQDKPDITGHYHYNGWYCPVCQY